MEKYIKTLQIDGADTILIQQTKDELHKSFASLRQEEQKYANIFLNDLQRGDIAIDGNKTFREYINHYQFKAKNDQIRSISQALGLDETKLKAMMNCNISETNINEYGRFDDLKDSVDKIKAKAYFEKLEGTTILPFKVNIRIHNFLQKFIINEGLEM